MDVYEKRFPVIEIFGPTIQGEGPEVGTQAHFVRFGGCDFRCAWCDSPQAVLPARVRLASKMTAGEIVKKVQLSTPAPLVVLSGGNPLLHELSDVVDWLHDAEFQVSVETQGTLWKQWINRVDQVVVSPKPPSSKMPGGDRTLTGFLTRTTVPVVLKVPCLDRRDVEWTAALADAFPDYPLFVSVVTLAADMVGQIATSPDDEVALLARTREVLGIVQEYPALRRARIFPQIHFLLWGNERGH